MAVTVSGRKEARKMRKMAARSPTPNHRMEIGIQASGEIGRKIWISGFNAISERRYQPISRPIGMASNAAATYPQVTRNKEATMYFNNRPRLGQLSDPGRNSQWPGQNLGGRCGRGEMPRHEQNQDESNWPQPNPDTHR